MDSGRIIIMTCGTSILDKNAGKEWPTSSKTEEFCSESFEVYPDDFSLSVAAEADELLEDNYKEERDSSKNKLFERPLACSLHIRNLNHRDRECKQFVSWPDPFPAEVSSLLLGYFEYGKECQLKPKVPLEKRDKDFLYLLHSDTSDGKKAAQFLMLLFKKTPFSDFVDFKELIKLDGINPMDVDAFSTNGIASLADAILKIHNDHRDREIVMDITGGFKGVLAPAETLAQCLPGITVRYLFEFSPSHVNIPELPISLDLLGYFEHRGALRALDSASPDQGEALRGSLPETLKGLYEPSKDSYIKHPIGKKLTELIDKMKQDQTLPSPYGSARNFASLIDDSQMSSYFRGLVLKRQYHWYGDVIPETVPHDRGHAQRLLEMAFQLLMPLKQANPAFFNETLPPWAVMVLLCSLWMHDVGHAGGKIKPDWLGREININRYPAIVRDLHHYLGYERILANKDDEFFPPEIEGMSMPSFEGQTLNRCVAISYLYHRKKIAWDGNTDLGKASPYWSWLGQAHKKPLQDYFSEWTDNRLSIMKRVISLQRLVDAFDVVNERVGALELRAHKTHRLEEDIEAEWSDFTAFEEQIKNEPYFFPESEWGDIKKKMMEYWEKDTSSSALSENFRGLSKKQLDEKDKLLSKIEPSLAAFLKHAIEKDNAILQHYLAHVYHLLFKPIQMAHYAKHAAVESTVILPDKFKQWKNKWGEDADSENNIARFQVILTYGPETKVNGIEDWMKEYVKPLLEDEMKKEFTPQVLVCLQEMRMSFSSLVARMPNQDPKEDWEEPIQLV
jgi:hypothetical protein